MAECSASIAATNKPTCVLVLGMAGSGKTTFVSKLVDHMRNKGLLPYAINLDPAVYKVPYPVNIDIRDTVKYKEVRNQYSLGPNAGIMTSLNLFTTKFDQVMQILRNRSNQCKYYIIDTPGQIEVFTWSASGAIITEALASEFPTMVAYVVDTAKNIKPVTFMSNMLYACGILYKTKLPFVIVFNKTDLVNHSFAVEWMHNFEAFDDALSHETTFISSFSRSLCLVLDEFYTDLKSLGISSISGEGIDDFFKLIDVCSAEFEKEYRPMYQELQKCEVERKLKQQEELLKKLKLDVGMNSQPVTEKKIDHPYLGLGFGDDEEDENNEIDVDEDEEEKEAFESFKRFLDQQKTSPQNDDKT